MSKEAYGMKDNSPRQILWSLDQPPLLKSTTKVISKTFLISGTQGTMGDQFPSKPRCHLPSSLPRKTPWRDKNHWDNHLRISETFSSNLFRTKCSLTGLNIEPPPPLSPKSYFIMKEWRNRGVMRQVSPKFS